MSPTRRILLESVDDPESRAFEVELDLGPLEGRGVIGTIATAVVLLSSIDRTYRHRKREEAMPEQPSKLAQDTRYVDARQVT
jgi:hypothetical protein